MVKPTIPDPSEMMASLQKAQDPNAARAQRLLSGAMMSAVLTPSCDCGSCRRLRKVAQLTIAGSDEDLEDE